MELKEQLIENMKMQARAKALEAKMNRTQEMIDKVLKENK